MHFKRPIAYLALILGLAILLVSTGMALEKPTVHLTVRLDETGGTLILEVPAILPESWVEKIGGSITDAAEGGSGVSEPRVQNTQRDGEKFHALNIRFDSIEDMTAVLTGLELDLPSILGSVSLPGLFNTFTYSASESVVAKEYEIQATVSQKSAETLGRYLDLRYHVELPAPIVEHNGIDSDDAPLTWILEEGKAVDIYARAQSVIGVNTPIAPAWIFVALVLVLGGILAGVGYWIYTYGQRKQRSRREADLYLTSEPLTDEHGSWSEAMQDIDGVPVEDYDGEDVTDYDSQLDY